ncbi:MAG: class I SAM-dependent methyltransferase [Acetanaerobacterium sp.]
MNEEKFTGKASTYSKYRPTYPKAYIDYLYSEVGLKEDSIIADIGSGTGIFSRLLLSRGSTVLGIEPNDDMRRFAEKDLAGFKGYTSIKASAENTALPDFSVDFITVAQAFHWFDRSSFRLECKRILKYSGRVILVWNSRDSFSDMIIQNDNINKRYCPEFKGFSGGNGGGSPEQYADFFKDGHCDCQTFTYDLVLDEQGFIGRNLSSSYAPKENTQGYHAYVEELSRLFSQYADHGSLRFPNMTRSYVGEV